MSKISPLLYRTRSMHRAETERRQRAHRQARALDGFFGIFWLAGAATNTGSPYGTAACTLLGMAMLYIAFRPRPLKHRSPYRALVEAGMGEEKRS